MIVHCPRVKQQSIENGPTFAKSTHQRLANLKNPPRRFATCCTYCCVMWLEVTKPFFYPTQHFWMLFEKNSFSLNKSCFYAWLVIDSRQLKWAYNLFSKSSWFTACGSLVIDNLTKSLEIVLLVKCIIKSYYPKTSFCTANHYNQFGRK